MTHLVMAQCGKRWDCDYSLLAEGRAFFLSMLIGLRVLGWDYGGDVEYWISAGLGLS